LSEKSIDLVCSFHTLADWQQSLESKMPSQTKKEVDMEITRQPATHIPFSQTTTTVAESYQTKLNNRRPSNQMDSSLSASPVATTPLRNTISSVQEAGQAHALPGDRSLVNSGEFILCSAIQI
jgi:hypothetical protein